MRVTIEMPDQPEVVALIEALDRYTSSLYPPASRHPVDIAALKRPNILFAVARDGLDEAIGCGAVVLMPRFGELKRMFVVPQFRAQGVARTILGFLEREASMAGCGTLKLESGVHQPEALGFYESAGYARCGPFGQYSDDPLCVFMSKRIGA